MLAIRIVQAALIVVFASTLTFKSVQAQSAPPSALLSEGPEREPQAYVLSEVSPQDREMYRDYLVNVLPIIERHGGFVVINPFEPKTVIEGRELEGNLALIAFPDAASRDAFWNSPEYQPWKAARQASSVSRVIHIN